MAQHRSPVLLTGGTGTLGRLVMAGPRVDPTADMFRGDLAARGKHRIMLPVRPGKALRGLIG